MRPTASAGASFQYTTKDGERIQLLPEMHLTREQVTKAFLATRNMDQDNIATRMIQAKHTGRWRYACQALHHYMDNPKNARMGRNAPFSNPHANVDDGEPGEAQQAPVRPLPCGLGPVASFR